ncbi:unnamed protein product [Toxocara canis]|nr:unnamed protein product [Toxocara canis]
MELAMNDEEENNYCLTLRRLAATNEFSRKSGAKWIIRCHGCHEPLSRMMAFKGQLLYTMGNAWHRQHFRCIRCHCRVGPDGREFRACRTDRSVPLCIDCHMEENHPKCAGCGKALREKCARALNKQWHRCCLVCTKCHSPFPNLEFYVLNGKPYDTDCFYLTKYGSLLTPVSQGTSFSSENVSVPFDQVFGNMPSGAGVDPIVMNILAKANGPAPSQEITSGKEGSASTASSGTSIADTKVETSSSSAAKTKSTTT